MRKTRVDVQAETYDEMCLCISEVKRRGERVEEIRKSCITRWEDKADMMMTIIVVTMMNGCKSHPCIKCIPLYYRTSRINVILLGFILF